MKPWIGRWLMGTAFIHFAVASVQHRSVVFSLVEHGVFNAVAGDPVAGAVAWSLLFGLVAFIGGLAVSALERFQVPLPKSIGGSLLALALIGAILVPVSGFWLLFPPAISILFTKRSEASAIARTQPAS